MTREPPPNDPPPDRLDLATIAALSLPAQILDGLADPAVMVTLDAVVGYWNRAAASVYGWTAAEAIGHPLSKLLQTRFLDGLTPEEIRATLKRQQFWRGEVIQRHRHGHELIFEASLSLVRDPGGAPIGVLAINRDISRTREAAAARRRSEHLLQSALDHLPDALTIYDPGRHIQFVNAAGIERIARPELQLLGRRAEQVLAPRSPPTMSPSSSVRSPPGSRRRSNARSPQPTARAPRS